MSARSLWRVTLSERTCSCPLREQRYRAASVLMRCALAQVNSGLMAAEEFVRVVSTEVARTFNVYPQKGVVAAGSDADVIVFDPTRKHTISVAAHHSAMDTNVFEGWTVTGKVRALNLH